MFAKPVGYRQFHREEHFNFQLNRWLPFLPEQELFEVAKKIENFKDWKHVMLEYAAKSEGENRLVNAAFYHRAAEFFMSKDDPDKKTAYQNFVSLFSEVAKGIAYKRAQIPYQNGYLPALVVEPKGKIKDTLVIHGGFDSFMEELFPILIDSIPGSYRVILFEGPGQGLPLREFGMTMPYNWEQPVAAVLDHFEVDTCTLLGISLGGYLATRAAAFEPRIKRVIADDVLEDFYGLLAHRVGPVKARLLDLLLKFKLKNILNALLAKAAKKDIVTAWAMEQGLQVSGAHCYYDYLKWAQSLNTRDISKNLTQDYLLLAGREDHMIPVEQFYRQARSLTNVRSFTGRIFSNEEDAGNHCHVGNYGLANEFIFSWLESIRQTAEQEVNEPNLTIDDGSATATKDTSSTAA